MSSPEQAPEVSVLLPFRNTETTLRECMDSVLEQNDLCFEVIAVNDYSDDCSEQLLREYKDQRIRITNSPVRGLVPALNYGLSLCRAPLIARMDADDIMRPGRLSKQKNYMQLHSAVALVATQVNKFPEQEIKAGYREYIRWQNNCISSDDVQNQIYIESPFAHPSVMFRKNIIESVGAYRQGEFPEDYDLWLRLFQAGHKMEKISQVLLDWRESENRLSRVSSHCSREAFDRLRAKYLALDKRIQRRPLAYWGAGRRTRLRAQHLIEKGFKPDVWIDVDAHKIGNVIQGAKVVEPEWLDKDDKPFVLNYVTNHGARDEVRAYLEGIGYKLGEHYLDVG